MLQNINFYKYSDACSRRIDGTVEQYVIFTEDSPIISKIVVFELSNYSFLIRDPSESEKKYNNDIRNYWNINTIRTIEDLQLIGNEIIISYNHWELNYEKYFEIG